MRSRLSRRERAIAKATQHLPADPKRPATRKRYAQLIHRVLSLAVYPTAGRTSEVMRLTERDVDLERGVVTIDRNGTDDARALALTPSVTRALKPGRRGPHTPSSSPTASRRGCERTCCSQPV